MENLLPAKEQLDIISFVCTAMLDGTLGYKTRKCVHGHWQAGAGHCGAPFSYNAEGWPESPIPLPFLKLGAVATEHTGCLYDTVLLKVYTVVAKAGRL